MLCNTLLLPLALIFFFFICFCCTNLPLAGSEAQHLPFTSVATTKIYLALNTLFCFQCNVAVGAAAAASSGPNKKSSFHRLRLQLDDVTYTTERKVCCKLPSAMYEKR